MKYFFALISLVWFAHNATQAQFTLTFADHYPSIGDEIFYTNHINTQDTLDVINGGAGLIWDFSGMEGGEQLSYKYEDPSDGLFPDDYPNADWVEIGLGYAGGSYSPGEAYY